MRIVSINLNQRFGNERARSCFENWLQPLKPDLLLAQEPWRPASASRPSPAGYRLAAATSLLAAWVPSDSTEPRAEGGSERWQVFRFPGLVVHHVYLSPHSSKERREHLAALTYSIVPKCSSVVLGDFNLAPRPQDGLFGDKPSRFTGRSEREAFEALLISAGLLDATAKASEPEFTFERWQNGKPIRFRCDLALLSACLGDKARAIYDHSVRSASGFTDHSALIVDLVTPQPSDTETAARSSGAARALERQPPSRKIPSTNAVRTINAHKTAIRRSAPSQIARCLEEQGLLAALNVRSILDFGCGYGADVLYYRSLAIEADGYDVESKFGWPLPARTSYDLVTVVFVVNVLPTRDERLAAVRAAVAFARPGGSVLVAARSEAAVAAEAKRGGWARFNDGWISSASKGTFQRGIRREELGWLLGAAGLELADVSLRLTSDVSWLVGRKRDDR